jgi:hypothetical protein
MNLTIERLLELDWRRSTWKGKVFYRYGNLILVPGNAGWNPGYFFSEPAIRFEFVILSEEDLIQLLNDSQDNWNFQ